MQTTTNPGKQRGIALGLTAGLVGGTAAGLVFGVPGLTGATSSTDAPAAIVQQVDEPADVADREPGERLRELLQDLVDDGTLTAAQADAVTQHLVENRPDFGDRAGRHHRRHAGRMLAMEVVTEVLGIDAETLRTELQGGASLADVATANGVDPQVLIDALVAEAQGRLDEAVANGDMDAEKAAEISESLEERITARVNGERPARPDAPADN